MAPLLIICAPHLSVVIASSPLGPFVFYISLHEAPVGHHKDQISKCVKRWDERKKHCFNSQCYEDNNRAELGDISLSFTLSLFLCRLLSQGMFLTLPTTRLTICLPFPVCVHVCVSIPLGPLLLPLTTPGHSSSGIDFSSLFALSFLSPPNHSPERVYECVLSYIHLCFSFRAFALSRFRCSIIIYWIIFNTQKVTFKCGLSVSGQLKTFDEETN